MEQLIQKQRVDINGMIDWNNLSYELDYIDTLILKMVYYPRTQTLTFNEIFMDLNKGKLRPIISKYALRKKLLVLEQDLILKVIKSKPLIIWPVKELSEKNMLLLLKNTSIQNKMERIE